MYVSWYVFQLLFVCNLTWIQAKASTQDHIVYVTTKNEDTKNIFLSCDCTLSIVQYIYSISLAYMCIKQKLYRINRGKKKKITHWCMYLCTIRRVQFISTYRKWLFHCISHLCDCFNRNFVSTKLNNICLIFIFFFCNYTHQHITHLSIHSIHIRRDCFVQCNLFWSTAFRIGINYICVHPCEFRLFRRLMLQ